jgi:hypothetical protein
VDTNTCPLGVTLLASLLSGLIGVLVSGFYYRRFEKRKLKLDTFRRLFAYRHAGVPGSSQSTQESFFSTLNEVFVVFHDAPEVIQALQTLHAELQRPERMQDNLVTLFKAMCRHLNIPLSAINDSFFLHPFIPGPGVARKP